MIEVKFEENNNIRTEPLYQWDSNQLLHIVDGKFGSVAPRVHFANKKSTEAKVVEPKVETDGSIIASIPNTLLKEKYDIIAYVYTNTGLTSKTITTITIPVIARLQPSEYIDITDDDIVEIEKIELEAKAIIDGLTASEYNPSETYNRPNIVYYQNSSYMCIGKNVTGALPTDTTKWTKIANGFDITNISVNQDGNLVFTTSNGDNFVVEIATEAVDYVGLYQHNICISGEWTEVGSANKLRVYFKVLSPKGEPFTRDNAETHIMLNSVDAIFPVVGEIKINSDTTRINYITVDMQIDMITGKISYKYKLYEKEPQWVLPIKIVDSVYLQVTDKFYNIF